MIISCLFQENEAGSCPLKMMFVFLSTVNEIIGRDMSQSPRGAS